MPGTATAQAQNASLHTRVPKLARPNAGAGGRSSGKQPPSSPWIGVTGRGGARLQPAQKAKLSFSGANLRIDVPGRKCWHPNLETHRPAICKLPVCLSWNRKSSWLTHFYQQASLWWYLLSGSVQALLCTPLLGSSSVGLCVCLALYS